jgi:heme/copper-type cytochrome/quinol oxidase subunit 2
MQGNVGKTDQMIRYVLAIVLIAVSIFTEIYWILIPAIIVGFTAATSWCGLYKLLGIDTLKKNNDED